MLAAAGEPRRQLMLPAAAAAVIAKGHWMLSPAQRSQSRSVPAAWRTLPAAHQASPRRQLHLRRQVAAVPVRRPAAQAAQVQVEQSTQPAARAARQLMRKVPAAALLAHISAQALPAALIPARVRAAVLDCAAQAVSAGPRLTAAAAGLVQAAQPTAAAAAARAQRLVRQR